jgi:hypothetical protein
MTVQSMEGGAETDATVSHSGDFAWMYDRPPRIWKQLLSPWAVRLILARRGDRLGDRRQGHNDDQGAARIVRWPRARHPRKPDNAVQSATTRIPVLVSCLLVLHDEGPLGRSGELSTGAGVPCGCRRPSKLRVSSSNLLLRRYPFRLQGPTGSDRSHHPCPKSMYSGSPVQSSCVWSVHSRMAYTRALPDVPPATVVCLVLLAQLFSSR